MVVGGGVAIALCLVNGLGADITVFLITGVKSSELEPFSEEGGFGGESRVCVRHGNGNGNGNVKCG